MIKYRFTFVIVILTLLSSISKTQTIQQPLFQFNQNTRYIPHPDKAYRGGQDAYYSSNQLLVVADGVGGWADQGIDPAMYSRFLCSKSSELFKENQNYYRQNPIELISEASKLNQNLGSSTMVVLTLLGDKLKTCYLGDSGFVIFRLNDTFQYELFFEFKEQQHGFNYPFQLARKEYYGDDPSVSICQDFTIRQSDIVVVGSDGLFDNIFVSQILAFINQYRKNGQQILNLASQLAQLAILRGKDRKFQSPFAKRGKQLNQKVRGGKLDDTTVIVSKIKAINPTPNLRQETVQRQDPKQKPGLIQIQDLHQILNIIKQDLKKAQTNNNQYQTQIQISNNTHQFDHLASQNYDQDSEIMQNHSQISQKDYQTSQGLQDNNQNLHKSQILYEINQNIDEIVHKIYHIKQNLNENQKEIKQMEFIKYDVEYLKRILQHIQRDLEK